jgi:hypothetical protein
MAIGQLTLTVVEGIFAVCRLEPDAPIPPWAAAGDFVSITRTGDELSIVVRQDAVPKGICSERGWCCLRVDGAIPFSEIGILAALTAALAESGVSVFAVSTFDTDYVLVKHKDLVVAAEALRGHGHFVL